MKKKVLIWGGIGIALIAVILVVCLVILPSANRNHLVGCEYRVTVSELENYQIRFEKEKVILYHNFYRKNPLSASGISKDTDKSRWQEFDYKYEYDGCIDVPTLPYCS